MRGECGHVAIGACGVKDDAVASDVAYKAAEQLLPPLAPSSRSRPAHERKAFASCEGQLAYRQVHYLWRVVGDG